MATANTAGLFEWIAAPRQKRKAAQFDRNRKRMEQELKGRNLRASAAPTPAPISKTPPLKPKPASKRPVRKNNIPKRPLPGSYRPSY